MNAPAVSCLHCGLDRDHACPECGIYWRTGDYSPGDAGHLRVEDELCTRCRFARDARAVRHTVHIRAEWGPGWRYAITSNLGPSAGGLNAADLKCLLRLYPLPTDDPQNIIDLARAFAPHPVVFATRSES